MERSLLRDSDDVVKNGGSCYEDSVPFAAPADGNEASFMKHRSRL